MYNLVLSQKFQKQIKQVVRSNPQIKPRLAKTFELLRKKINYPSLRLHKLSGQNNWSVSVTRNIRIILHIEEDNIYLLRIGTHDEVYY
jgi:addiction module RelE/StbE family toxin